MAYSEDRGRKQNRQWSIRDKKIIEFVKANPMIYDKRQRPKKYIKTIKSLFQKFGKAMGLCPQKCYFRWQLIRKNYTCERNSKKIRPKYNDGSLSFLDTINDIKPEKEKVKMTCVKCNGIFRNNGTSASSPSLSTKASNLKDINDLQKDTQDKDTKLNDLQKDLTRHVEQNKETTKDNPIIGTIIHKISRNKYTWSKFDKKLFMFVRNFPIIYKDKPKSADMKRQIVQHFKDFAKYCGKTEDFGIACKNYWRTIHTSYKRFRNMQGYRANKYKDPILSFLKNESNINTTKRNKVVGIRKMKLQRTHSPYTIQNKPSSDSTLETPTPPHESTKKSVCTNNQELGRKKSIYTEHNNNISDNVIHVETKGLLTNKSIGTENNNCLSNSISNSISNSKTETTKSIANKSIATKTSNTDRDICESVNDNVLTKTTKTYKPCKKNTDKQAASCHIVVEDVNGVVILPSIGLELLHTTQNKQILNSKEKNSTSTLLDSLNATNNAEMNKTALKEDGSNVTCHSKVLTSNLTNIDKKHDTELVHDCSSSQMECHSLGNLVDLQENLPQEKLDTKVETKAKDFDKKTLLTSLIHKKSTWTDFDRALIRFVKDHPIIYETNRKFRRRKERTIQLFAKFVKKHGQSENYATACLIYWRKIKELTLAYKSAHNKNDIEESKYNDKILSFLKPVDAPRGNNRLKPTSKTVKDRNLGIDNEISVNDRDNDTITASISNSVLTKTIEVCMPETVCTDNEKLGTEAPDNLPSSDLSPKTFLVTEDMIQELLRLKSEEDDLCDYIDGNTIAAIVEKSLNSLINKLNCKSDAEIEKEDNDTDAYTLPMNDCDENSSRATKVKNFDELFIYNQFSYWEEFKQWP